MPVILNQNRISLNTFGNRHRDDRGAGMKGRQGAFRWPPSSPGLRMSPHGFRLQERISRQELRHRQLEEVDRGLGKLHTDRPLPPPSRITLGKLLNLSVCSSVN